MKTNDKLVELVKKVKAGDNDAFTCLYDESYKYLYTCVIHIVKDENIAQDMLQEAYIEIYKNIGQLKDDTGFLGWAATIANRKCFAYLKKSKDVLLDEHTDDEGNENDYYESVADDEAFIPENILDNQEKIKIIRGLIDDLTDIQRACVIGFFYNEQKQDEIANELGIPINTVKSHINRAKKRIKEAVVDIEKEQGIKLYSVAPFMVIFFLKDVEVYAAEITVPVMGAGLSAAISGGVTTGITATVGAKATGIAIKAKLIVGIAAVVTIGSIGIAMLPANTTEGIASEETVGVSDKEILNSSYVDIYIDDKELLDSISIYDIKMSEASIETIMEHVDGLVEKYANTEGVVYEEIIDDGYRSHQLEFYDGPTSGVNFAHKDCYMDDNISVVVSEYKDGIKEDGLEVEYCKDVCFMEHENESGWFPGLENYSYEKNVIQNTYITSVWFIVRNASVDFCWKIFENGDETIKEIDMSDSRENIKTNGSGNIVPSGNYFKNDNKGKKLEYFLNSYYEGLYDALVQYGEVEFKNGYLGLSHNSNNNSSYLNIFFNDSDENDYKFNTIRYRCDEEERIIDVELFK